MTKVARNVSSFDSGSDIWHYSVRAMCVCVCVLYLIH